MYGESEQRVRAGNVQSYEKRSLLTSIELGLYPFSPESIEKAIVTIS